MRPSGPFVVLPSHPIHTSHHARELLIKGADGCTAVGDQIRCALYRYSVRWYEGQHHSGVLRMRPIVRSCIRDVRHYSTLVIGDGERPLMQSWATHKRRYSCGLRRVLSVLRLETGKSGTELRIVEHRRSCRH